MDSQERYANPLPAPARRSWRRRLAVGILLPLVAALVFSGVKAQPASAAVLYPVYYYQVCQHQNHFGASLWKWSPYGWYCYDLSVPLGVTWAGGLDIQGYCAWKYPGSWAYLYDKNTPYGWRCARNCKPPYGQSAVQETYLF